MEMTHETNDSKGNVVQVSLNLTEYPNLTHTQQVSMTHLGKYCTDKVLVVILYQWFAFFPFSRISFILQVAEKCDGAIISNDNYKDLLNEKPGAYFRFLISSFSLFYNRVLIVQNGAISSPIE